MLPPLFRTTAIVCPVSPCTAIRPGHAILRGFLVQPQNIILPLLVVAEIFVSRIRIFGSFFSLPFVRFVSLLFKKRPGPRFSLCLLRIFAAKKFVSRICISSSFFSLPFVCFVSLLFKIISPRFSFVLRAAPLKPPLWSFWSFSSFAFLCGPCVRTCFSPFHSRPFASIRGSLFSLPFVRFVSLLFKKRPGPRFSLCLLRIFAAKKFVSRICISSSSFSLPFVCIVTLLFKIISPRFSFVPRAAPLKPPLWSFWSFSSFAFHCGPCVRTCFSPFHSRPFASIRGSLFSLPFCSLRFFVVQKTSRSPHFCAFCAFLRLKNLFREFAFAVRLFLFPSFALLLCCSKSSRPVFLWSFWSFSSFAFLCGPCVRTCFSPFHSRPFAPIRGSLFPLPFCSLRFFVVQKTSRSPHFCAFCAFLRLKNLFREFAFAVRLFLFPSFALLLCCSKSSRPVFLWSFWSFSSFAFLCGPCVKTCFSPFHSRPFASIRGSFFSLPFVRFVSLLFKKRPGPRFSLCLLRIFAAKKFVSGIRISSSSFSLSFVCFVTLLFKIISPPFFFCTARGPVEAAPLVILVVFVICISLRPLRENVLFPLSIRVPSRQFASKLFRVAASPRCENCDFPFPAMRISQMLRRRMDPSRRQALST